MINKIYKNDKEPIKLNTKIDKNGPVIDKLITISTYLFFAR